MGHAPYHRLSIVTLYSDSALMREKPLLFEHYSAASSWRSCWAEDEASAFRSLITESDGAVASAGNAVELAAVASGRDDLFDTALEFLREPYIAIEAVDAEQAGIAAKAYRRYGKGRHPAGLNSGDMFAYALARQRGVPLLFKGGDFAQTDVAVADIASGDPYRQSTQHGSESDPRAPHRRIKVVRRARGKATRAFPHYRPRSNDQNTSAGHDPNEVAVYVTPTIRKDCARRTA